MKRFTFEITLVLVVLLGIGVKAFAEDWPGDRLTDQMRADGIEALKGAYVLNGFSMVGPTIDMTGLKKPIPFPDADPEGGIWPKPVEKPVLEKQAEANICTRHGMRKVVTGSSWRCRK